MAREIVESKPVLLSAKSFDGKHTIQFNEASHRYKLNGKAAVGTTTFVKAGYPTSMSLVSWMKGQSIQHLWNSLCYQMDDSMLWRYRPYGDMNGISEERRIELFKEAKNADKKPAQEAADIGTLIHDYAYLVELGREQEAQALYDQIIQLPVKDKIIGGIEKFKKWKETNKDELVASESLVASPTYLFCGKFDRLAKRNGRLVLDDFKSSNSIYLEHFIQLGAYSIAIREWMGMTVEALEILRFGKDDGEFESLTIDDPLEIKRFEEQAIRCRETYEFAKLSSDPRFEWKGKK